jgi:hypothetical protein
MAWLALAFAMQREPEHAPAPSGWVNTGRIVDEPALHVGLRPAAFADPEGDRGLEWGLGATLQVTVASLP